MGEFADMAIGDIVDHDDYFWGEDTLEGYGGHRQTPQCKYCGSLEVGWRVDDANRWRLINLADHKPHTPAKSIEISICRELEQYRG